MLILALEILICAAIGLGVIVVLVLYNRSHPDIFNNDERKRINFLPTSVGEEILVQNTLIAYYDQQKNELIERQKMTEDKSKFDTTLVPNNDSGYTSIHSPEHTPHSVYECTGFASMEDLEISNPLFESYLICNHEQTLIPSPLTTK